MDYETCLPHRFVCFSRAGKVYLCYFVVVDRGMDSFFYRNPRPPAYILCARVGWYVSLVLINPNVT